MELRFLYRPRGGKTVEAVLVLDEDCRVKDVAFTGDFFVYPDWVLEALEERLRGCSSRDCIASAFHWAAENGRPLGFTWTGLMERLVEEWEQACRHAAQKPR